ncbi:MAG: bacterial Ig-like domain-containing protein [Paludibacteraceae bacterium]|nr:bacterial Ig-like domain-containing protein [Paludibacteraceae bacterium]
MGESASTATLQSIEITGTPTKTTYMAGEAFSTDGLKVMGNYDDDTQKEITEGITWTVTPATLTAGTTQVSVTATAEGKSTTRTITGLTVTAPKTLTSIAVSGTPAEFWKGDTFNHNGMTVTAKWDDASTTDVTAEATFSEPDMATAGVKTITVTYKDKTATYDITVKTIANTQETAYTTTQAIALIDAGKDLTANVYVKGTISQIDGYSSGTITYWLDQNTFEVFKGKNLNNTNFTAEDDVVKGAEVIVYGQITKFGSTYEFNTGNYLASYKAPDVVKQDPTLTLGTYKTSMDANEANDEYSVTYDGDGTLSVTSSNEEVATVTINGTNIVVDALAEGTTTISVSATETDTYYFVEKKYTLTVYPAWVAASLPFTFDGGKSSISPKNGIKQSGLGSDYDSSPKLKFGETGASLIIWFNETAASVSYSIKGNPSSGTWSGTFDVLESKDNQNYSAVESYTDLTQTTLTETKTLSSSTRYIKFVYSNKAFGNVALGAIKIAKPSTPSAIDNAAVETPAVKTIENGQLVILRDGVKYNAMGVRLQ